MRLSTIVMRFTVVPFVAAGILLLAVLHLPATAQTEVKLMAEDPIAWGDFGREVVLGKGRLLVGAPHERWHTGTPGAAYVFARTNEGWVQEAKLNPAISTLWDDFGYSLDLDGKFAVVGAPSIDGYGSGAGRAFIFRRSETRWNHQKMFEFEGTEGLGVAVGLSGYTVAMADFHRVWVYRYNGDFWDQQAVLPGGDPLSSIRSMVFEDDVLIVVDREALFPFFRNGSDWSAGDPIALESFTDGDARDPILAMDGEWLAVSVPDHTSGELEGEGAVYMLKRAAGTWTREYRVTPDPAVLTSGYGESVAIDGNRLVVGVPRAEKAFMYRLIGDEWVPDGPPLEAVDHTHMDSYGSSVEIELGGELEEGTVVVGAPDHTAEYIQDRGAVYVYEGLIPPTLVEIDPERFRLLAKILVGVIGGGGGWAWIPGEGIVPIDPDPFRLLGRLSPTERDVVIGLAVRELGEMTSSPEYRSALEAAGNRIMDEALENLKAEQPR